MDKFKFYDLLQTGYQNIRIAGEKKDAETAGIWRGGSSGCITPAGAIVGADPREVVLRFLGIQTKNSYDSKLMFDEGLGNEESVNALLDAAKVEYRCEEDFPMKYTLPSGEVVTGRPDCVLGKRAYAYGGEVEHFIPTLGIEHKAICSPFGAYDRASFGRVEADPKHFVQAAHYAGYFDIPWVLAYTSRVWHLIPGFVTRDESKWLAKDPDHRAISRDEKSGKAFMLKPFQSFYDITMDEEGFFLQDGEKTAISKDGITAFYMYCSNAIKNKEIPKLRSGGVDHFGKKTRKNKSLLYYEFKEADGVTDFDEWVEACRQIAEES